MKAQEGNFSEVFASEKDRPLLINSFIFISKTNKQKAQSNLLGFFFLGCIVLVSCFPPFKFHAVSSHLFLSCVKINILCALIQILHGIGINKNKCISCYRKEQCSRSDPERGGLLSHHTSPPFKFT